MIVINTDKKIFTMDVEKDPIQALEFARDLKKHRMKGEFYVVGSIFMDYSDVILKIHRLGHLIGGHGLEHVDFTKIPEWEQRVRIKTLMNIFEDNGLKMTEWRFPYLSFTKTSLQILAELDIIDASMRLLSLNKWGRFFPLWNFMKNFYYSRMLEFPWKFPNNLVEKPFVAVDIERPDFFRETGRLLTHCYNYHEFKDKVFNKGMRYGR